MGSDEATNDLALPVNGVSRRHASIIYGDGRYRIIDLNSTNGTFVNGRRVDSTILQNGDEIRFGPACFVFSASPADREAATSPAKQVLSRSRSLSVRTLAEIVLIAFVVGFGAAQYIAYLFYHEQNRLLLAKAEPLRVQPLPAKASAGTPSPATGTTNPTHIGAPSYSSAPRAARKLARTKTTSEEPAKAVRATERRSLPASLPKVGIQPNELRAAVRLTGLFTGSGNLGGRLAPDFTLDSLSSGPVSLSAFRGKVVLLNFWATWCPSCRGEMPSLAQLFKDFRGDSNFVVLTVSVDQRGAAAVQPFIKEKGYDFPVLLDSQNSVSSKYEVRGIPSTFLIGRAGEILWNVTGGVDWSSNQITKALKEALASPPRQS